MDSSRKLISPELLAKLNTLGDFLSSNIIAQQEVLDDVVTLLSRAFCKLRFDRRPVASMLFLGPTGVGKTETVNLFNRHLFGSEDKLVRLDMSEYMMVDSIGILRGRTTRERGLLGIFYDRSQGSGTLLFDEIEKAHPLIMDVFLQILSAARFTVATGDALDLSNYVVVATSNIGSEMLMESRTTDRETLVRRTIQAVIQDMRPEIYARFDLQGVFNKFNYEALQRIGQLHLNKCLTIINAQGHHIWCETGVLDHVQREGYTERFGARPMQNAAMRILGDIVMHEMLSNGGNPVKGAICYDRQSNRCFLKAESLC